ncbi:hypothetical protein I552_6056 [Mycobacterium xenopi 3993]|nr:hypothetical protein I552_6056 [Mycobacterium xenopi 3993]
MPSSVGTAVIGVLAAADEFSAASCPACRAADDAAPPGCRDPDPDGEHQRGSQPKSSRRREYSTTAAVPLFAARRPLLGR